MTITKIERQERRKNRFSVYIEDRFAFGLDGADLLYYHLEEGIELSPEKYNDIITECLFQKARDKALRFLAYRARSKQEVVDKLCVGDNPETEGFPEPVVNRVVALLERYGYVDDERFAAAYARDKTKLRGFGALRIRQDLKQKGVSGDIIEKVFAALAAGAEMNEEETALALLSKRYRAREIIANEKEKQKACAFLLRKGYTYEIIEGALGRFYEQSDSD